MLKRKKPAEMLKKFLLPAMLVGSFLATADFIAAQAYVRIVSPQPEQCLPGPDVVVQYEAGGMTLGPDAWNLHFALDNEPFHVKYDGNTAKVFKDVAPGTHTVRVWLADQQHRAIQGTLQTVTFSVAYPNDENRPYPGAPMLTYNLPQGEYLGIDSADINLDFMVSNVALSPGGYQVAYYVDGRRFLVQDGVGTRSIKGLKSGYHNIKIELQDPQGIVVPGPFNSVTRTILVSPDRAESTPTEGYDPYARQPKIASLAGPMTMGQPWEASQPRPRALTAEEKKKVDGLTVGPRSRSAERAKDFDVREGGQPDDEVSRDEPQVLDTPSSPEVSATTSSVVRRTVTVEQSPAAPTATPTATPAPAASEAAPTLKDVSTPEGASAPAAVKTPAPASAAAKSAAATTGTAVRRSAPTTASLRLADRATTRTARDETTVTIRTENPNTTATRSGDRNTTGGPRRRPEGMRRPEGAGPGRGDRPTSGPRGMGRPRSDASGMLDSGRHLTASLISESVAPRRSTN